jgi:hypothetical protein
MLVKSFVLCVCLYELYRSKNQPLNIDGGMKRFIGVEGVDLA